MLILFMAGCDHLNQVWGLESYCCVKCKLGHRGHAMSEIIFDFPRDILKFAPRTRHQSITEQPYIR